MPYGKTPEDMIVNQQSRSASVATDLQIQRVRQPDSP
ncbi:hypothetical protein FHX64_002493 [Microbacter margulisiae]|uniref:Uncharacterized protein n=1 Tax=Microbacter margulisiae TaxID=1350067 RepID=A0A7W5DT58_9PORP|nr:hypothetical protein [Microbacter margulisiae]